MRRRKAFAPTCFDRLEDRLTLSHLGVHLATQVGPRHHAAHFRHHHHSLHGQNHQSGSIPTAPGTTPIAPGTTPTAPGTTPIAPGTTPTVAALVLTGKVEGRAPLDGSGTVGPLGVVTSTGTLSAAGAEPVTYTGKASLVGASGTITLSLSGRLFGPQHIGEPLDLTYTITGGTGAFRGATGSGKAVLSFELPSIFRPSPTPPANSFVLSFGDVA